MTHSRTKAGIEILNTNKIINEIYSLVKKEFPIVLTISHCQIIKISYDDVWENKKLTKNEITIIEDWITQKLK